MNCTTAMKEVQLNGHCKISDQPWPVGFTKAHGRRKIAGAFFVSAVMAAVRGTLSSVLVSFVTSRPTCAQSASSTCLAAAWRDRFTKELSP